ncbi:hypothetical protein [Arcobacter defluvii]|uniref:Uncharacterized protein n=1 Tax=Arcobacter defluvii TaxID=873191 RepID=A0AAE7E4Y1_9BACT|nr:hypothetical protein [Arcobacter defluvii]QKF76235.1 hypothetical protein ADFLV_0168 [Arcobacter defluvii]RXI30917.1 hypothetical protein CP964_10690 [Arcobacter defluvii]
MPYFVSSIIAIVSAMIILFTRYEADDSAITGELEKMKSMFITIDGFVNTYIQSGGDLSSINFEELYNNGILLGNIEKGTGKEVEGTNYTSTLTFPKSGVKWQLIPVRDINSNDANADFGDSAGSAYKLLVDMHNNSTLMSKAIFSESFSGREFCEKMLLGTLQRNAKTYVPIENKETFSFDGTDSDGYFVCIVFK